jgi:hypothetical protein
MTKARTSDEASSGAGAVAQLLSTKQRLIQTDLCMFANPYVAKSFIKKPLNFA